jgi:hypothetical protein
MISKQEKADLHLNKYPLAEAIGPCKSIKLLHYDLSCLDSREMYEYLGHEESAELPQMMVTPSHLQTKLLTVLSDIVNDLVRADGGDKFPDLTKFIKRELVLFLA